ncbi:hypothetical protein LPJ56_006669, partial [Coemansia sp. RSA 2599]
EPWQRLLRQRTGADSQGRRAGRRVRPLLGMQKRRLGPWLRGRRQVAGGAAKAGGRYAGKGWALKELLAGDCRGYRVSALHAQADPPAGAGVATAAVASPGRKKRI